MMNPNLSFADWHKLRNLDGGMYGIFNGDPNEPENPAETSAVPRILTLNPGQPLFRWVDSRRAGRSHHDKAAGCWWSSKRGAQAVVERARRAGTADTREHARWYSSVARDWSDLGEVVHVMVIKPIKVFMGVGRDIYDPGHGEKWESRGLQIYIPGMSENKNGVYTLSQVARSHLNIVWVKSSDAFDRWALEKAMNKGRKIANG